MPPQSVSLCVEAADDEEDEELAAAAAVRARFFGAIKAVTESPFRCCRNSICACCSPHLTSCFKTGVQVIGHRKRASKRTYISEFHIGKYFISILQAILTLLETTAQAELAYCRGLYRAVGTTLCPGLRMLRRHHRVGIH